MEYKPNGWVDAGGGTHIKYACGYTLTVTEVSKELRLFSVYVYSLHGVECINQQFKLEDAKLRADEWLSREAGRYSPEFPAYEKAFQEGYNTRVMEEKHGYDPYEK